MNGLNVYRLDYQGKKISESCAVIMHIGKEIQKVVKEKGVKVGWLAAQINTSRRNMQDIFNREDISVLTLARISKVLDHNFLYDIESEVSLTTAHEPYVAYNKEAELLKEQLELSKQLIESKDKLLAEYKNRGSKVGQ